MTCQNNKEMPANGLPVFLTTQEVAHCLRSTRYAVYKLVEDGKLKAVKPAGKLLIDSGSLKRLIAAS